MKLVMVTTAHSHWDGLAGNTAMFSEAVIPATILDELPMAAIDTIFIKKNPLNRRFENAWRGKSKNFRRITRQDKDNIAFEVEDLKKYDCPQVLQLKTVGCHILTENIDTPLEAPRRPISTNKNHEPKVPVIKRVAVPHVEEKAEEIIPVLLNGNGRHIEDEIVTSTPTKEYFLQTPEPKPISANQAVTEPGFFDHMKAAKNPSEFEQYCFYLLRLLGIHDIHRPINFAGADAHGFFKFNALSVVYTTTLVPGVLQDNPLVIEHYLNLLRKEKMRLANTSYTIKDTQKQIWLLCNSGMEVQHLRTDDGIKLKIVPAAALIELYRLRLLDSELNMDSFCDSMKNL